MKKYLSNFILIVSYFIYLKMFGHMVIAQRMDCGFFDYASLGIIAFFLAKFTTNTIMAVINDD